MNVEQGRPISDEEITKFAFSFVKELQSFIIDTTKSNEDVLLLELRVIQTMLCSNILETIETTSKTKDSHTTILDYYADPIFSQIKKTVLRYFTRNSLH